MLYSPMVLPSVWLNDFGSYSLPPFLKMKRNERSNPLYSNRLVKPPMKSGIPVPTFTFSASEALLVRDRSIPVTLPLTSLISFDVFDAFCRAY